MVLYGIVFFIPWTLFFLLIDKRKVKELSRIGIFTSLISFIVDYIFRFKLNLWSIPSKLPFLDVEFMASIGIFPVEAMLLLQFLSKTEKSWLWLACGLALALFNTFGEYILINFDLLFYHNHWNSFYTYILYFITLSTVAVYYRKCV